MGRVKTQMLLLYDFLTKTTEQHKERLLVVSCKLFRLFLTRFVSV